MTAWLAARTPEFREAVEVVVIDPHAGYAAVRAALPEAQVAVASKPRRFVNTWCRVAARRGPFRVRDPGEDQTVS